MSSSVDKPPDPNRFWGSSGPELADAFIDVMERMRRDYGEALDLITEMAQQDVSKAAGYPSLKLFLVHLTRLHPDRAARMIRHAGWTAETTTLTGQVMPAVLAATREAVQAGVVDADHVDTIAATIKKLPSWVSETDREVAERTLVAAARELDAKDLRGVADRLLATIDQDGAEPADRELAEPRNELRYRRTREGRMVGKFNLMPETGALFDTLIRTLGAPHPTTDEGPDPRCEAERHGDAMASVIEIAADSKDVPSQGRERPHLNVHIPLEALLKGVGHALLDGAGLITAREARMKACDCKLIPIVFNAQGAPLDVGHIRYTVPMPIRRALIARDLGCAYPGCRRRPRECHAHHVVEWVNGGPTEINNLVLLCSRHHRLIHFSEWHVEILNGLPVFYAPKWLDKDRRPRRNTTHIRLT